MSKKVYYQAQFSKDGETWEAFATNRDYNVAETLDEVKAVYEKMIEWHKKPFNSSCKYHRIVKLTVEVEEVIL